MLSPRLRLSPRFWARVRTSSSSPREPPDRPLQPTSRCQREANRSRDPARLAAETQTLAGPNHISPDRLFRMSRQTARHSLQIFAGPITRDLGPVPRLRQKLQRCLVLLAAIRDPVAVPLAARPAASTHESQMYTFGPAINLDTSLGARSHQVQTASGCLVRRRQTCHQLPPAAVTTCCTR